MMKMIQKEHGGILIELKQVEGLNVEEKNELSLKGLPDVLTAVINQFARVFEMPLGLPPNRGLEHQIVTKEGGDSMSL